MAQTLQQPPSVRPDLASATTLAQSALSNMSEQEHHSHGSQKSSTPSLKGSHSSQEGLSPPNVPLPPSIKGDSDHEGTAECIESTLVSASSSEKRDAEKTEKGEKKENGVQNNVSPTGAKELDPQHSRDGHLREDGKPYPTGFKLGLITLALCLSVFLIALDNAIIATAVPKITDQFHSLGDVGWYASGYLLTTASLQLLYGKLYTFFSIKWVYLVAIALFELGSLICGVANTSLTLIIGRAIAGIGAAGIFSGTLIILAHSVPMVRRPMYTGAIGAMYGIAVVAGPLLGGLFTDKVTWRWCFWINLPIGAVTVGVIAIWFHDPGRSSEEIRQRQQGRRMKLKQCDPIGSVLFIPGIISLLLALQWAGTEYPWRDRRIIALFTLFGVLMFSWLVVQYYQDEMATVPPRIIKKRTIWCSAFYSICVGSAFLTSVYFIPIWFQAVKGVSAVQSGIMNLPMLLAIVVSSLLAGCIVTFWGYYTPFLLGGTVCMGIGFGLMSTWNPDTASPIWIGYQVIAGFGLGMSFQQPLMAVQTVLDIEDIPVGTSLVVFLQTLGGAVFISVAQSVFTNELVQSLGSIIPGISPKTIIESGATGLAAVSSKAVPGLLQAVSHALTRTFLVCAGLGAASLVGGAVIEWKSVKGANVQMGMA